MSNNNPSLSLPDHNCANPLHERGWRLRWQRFAQSPAHRILALAAALCVTHGAVAQHQPDPSPAKSSRDASGLASELRPANPAKGKARASSKVRAKLQGVLNINKASAQQWQIFPGVGPSIANKIIKHRQNKSFRSVKQLREVKGIGPKFIQRFAGHLRINGPTTLTRKGGSKPRKKR